MKMLSAEIYDKSINWKVRLRNEMPLLQELMAKVQFNSQKSSERTPTTAILDLGCGSGNHLAQLNAFYPKNSFIGVDISKDMLRLAKSKEEQGNFQWELIEGDFLSIDFQDRKFQFIYSIGNSVLLMLQNRSLSTLLSKIDHILTSNGLFFLQILNNANPRSGYVASPLIRTEEGDAFHTLKRFSPDREKNLMHVDFIEFVQKHDQEKPEISVHPSFWPLITLEDIQRVVENKKTLRILSTWANYKKETFNPKTSNDLLIVFQKLSE